jgi:hypothetical protein
MRGLGHATLLLLLCARVIDRADADRGSQRQAMAGSPQLGDRLHSSPTIVAAATTTTIVVILIIIILIIIIIIIIISYDSVANIACTSILVGTAPSAPKGGASPDTTGRAHTCGWPCHPPGPAWKIDYQALLDSQS